VAFWAAKPSASKATGFQPAALVRAVSPFPYLRTSALLNKPKATTEKIQVGRAIWRGWL